MLFQKKNPRFFGKSSRKTRRLGRRSVIRHAIATVELAICLPVLVLLVFGSIQACDVIYLQHALNQAAYAGSSELCKSDATSESVRVRVEQMLTSRQIKSASVQILPSGSDISKAKPGTIFTIEAKAPPSNNLMLSGFFPTPEEMTGRVVSTR